MEPDKLQSLDSVMDILDDDTPEQGQSFEDIYAFLLEKEDIILTIDAADEEALKRGLTIVKYNHKKRLEKAGQRVQERQIKYKNLGVVEGTDPQQIRIQIWLMTKGSVNVHNMIVSDKGL